MQILSNANKLKVLLGWYQIIGGIIGFILTAIIPFNTTLTSFFQIIHLGIGFLLYSFSIICGTLLLKSRTKALTLSLINQFFQILFISILGFGFRYSSGIFFTIGIELSNGNILFEAGASSWQVEWNWESDSKAIHINIIALALIILIDNLRRKYNDTPVSTEIAELD